MKSLSREFTLKEKILLLILVLLLLGYAYYRFVDVPVRDGIREAKNEQENLKIELAVVQGKVKALERMQSELDTIKKDGTVKYMPSYNNVRNVNRLLNDTLSGLDYIVTYDQLTRDVDQIRRNVSIQFTSPDYATMERVVKTIADCEYRCLIDDLRGTVMHQRDRSYIVVNLNATFFETMVGGTSDAGLPSY